MVGECRTLGVRVSATSVRRILRRHGLGPVPRRGGPTWNQFLRSYTEVFDEVFSGEGIEVLRSPPQAPRANAYAERWGHRARECLNRMLIYSPQHLLAVLGEFVVHYDEHRPNGASCRLHSMCTAGIRLPTMTRIRRM